MRRILVAMLALIVAGLFPTAGANAQSDTRCFAETGQCISGAIRRYWERNGGLPVFGYPTGPLETMTIEGWTGPAQWFERDRLEDHSAQGQGVLAGRLGAERLQQLGRPWQYGGGINLTPQCRYFPETGYTMCGAFRAYWERNGGLERFGYPITAETTEFIDGRSYLVQYFERRRMEYHPENRPPYDVLLGLLGNEVRANQRSGAGCPVAVTPELQYNYNDFSRDSRLGCPLAGEDYRQTKAAAARFERGQMYWVNLRGGRSIVVAIFYEPNNRVSYQIFEDYWREGDPVSAGLTPPAGLYEPRRGFGKVWREQAGVRERLGWALEHERAATAVYQVFEQGSLLLVYDDSLVWQLQAGGAARSAPIRYY